MLTPPTGAVGAVGAPLAVVDLDRFDDNSERLHERASGMPIRIASKSLRVRSLIERVLGDPGYSGVLGYSVREAIWLAGHGFDDIVVAYPTVDRAAVAQIAADERLASAITLMVDLPDHVALVSEAAREAASVHPVRVAIDVDCSLRLGPLRLGVHRSPVRTAGDAETLAALIGRTEGTRLAGMMFYEAQVAGVPDAKTGMRAIKRMSNEQLRRERGEIRRAVERHADLEFVNGGGTGSLHTTRADPALTELAAGSGLFAPSSFDGFDGLDITPAAWFVSPVTRKPSDDVVVTFSGGYCASGVAGRSRSPVPVWPPGLRYFAREGPGEVQTPLRGRAARSLRVGDPVWFRHAKAGEMCERFDEVMLVSDGASVDRVPTYRGEGHNFG